MTTRKMKEKKRQRKSEIQQIAFELFCKKGIANTSIDQIVTLAEIAKGTFYLYFKNKKDLVDQLILRETSTVLSSAIKEMDRLYLENKKRPEKIVFVVDYIVSYLQTNPAFLEFIHKNLYQGILKKENRAHLEKTIKEITHIGVNVDTKIFQKKLYLILELVGSVCYNAIHLKQPYTIEEIKPMLYEAVKCIISI